MHTNYSKRHNKESTNYHQHMQDIHISDFVLDLSALYEVQHSSYGQVQQLAMRRTAF